MGFFSKSPPKPPRGSTWKSRGDDSLDTWSMGRIQSEIDRINSAKKYNEGAGKDLWSAEGNIRDLFNPRGGPGRSGWFKDTFIAPWATGDVSPGWFMNAASYSKVANLSMPAGHWLKSVRGANAKDVPLDIEHSIEYYRNDYDTRKDAAAQYESGGYRYHPSQGPPKPKFGYNEHELWTEYDAAKEAAQPGLDKLMSYSTKSGLGATGVGDEYWTGRLKTALAGKRAKFAAFRSQHNPQKRMAPDTLKVRDENQQRARRSNRGGGPPTRPAPLNTTETQGVI